MTMSRPIKRKVFSVQIKIDILAQVDPNKETYIALIARVEIVLSTLNTIVKKSLEPSPFQELGSLLATWFKQVIGCNK
jgi:hypothetical protein